ncbi:MAG: zf-HC2 domain-containing protein [Chloroflexi bacterium]|nr:zf-HC2 domain-containing protein [Chloroflexota bacterium]
MKCDKPEINEKLLAYLEGEIPPGDADEIRKHIESCSHCSSELESLRGTAALLREAGKAGECPPAEDIVRYASGIPVPEVEDHIAKCAACREEVSMLKAMDEELSSAGPVLKKEKLPKKLRKSLPLKEKPGFFQALNRLFLKPGPAMAVVGLLVSMVLVVLLLNQYLTSPGSPMMGYRSRPAEKSQAATETKAKEMPAEEQAAAVRDQLTREEIAAVSETGQYKSAETPVRTLQEPEAAGKAEPALTEKAVVKFADKSEASLKKQAETAGLSYGEKAKESVSSKLPESGPERGDRVDAFKQETALPQAGTTAPAMAPPSARKQAAAKAPLPAGYGEGAGKVGEVGKSAAPPAGEALGSAAAPMPAPASTVPALKSSVSPYSSLPKTEAMPAPLPENRAKDTLSAGYQAQEQVSGQQNFAEQNAFIEPEGKGHAYPISGEKLNAMWKDLSGILGKDARLLYNQDSGLLTVLTPKAPGNNAKSSVLELLNRKYGFDKSRVIFKTLYPARNSDQNQLNEPE